MKATPALLGAAAIGLLFSACETELPPQPANQATTKLQRGISGQGTLYQPDTTSDPIIKEQSRVGN